MKQIRDRHHQPVEGNLRKAYRTTPETPEPSELSRLLSRLAEALERLDRAGPEQGSERCH